MQSLQNAWLTWKVLYYMFLNSLEDFEVPSATYMLDLEEQLHQIEENFAAWVPPDKVFMHKEEVVVGEDEEPAEEEATRA